MTLQTPIEPIARFMPPVASTTIVENPMTMSMASDREIANRLKDDTKPGARLVKTTHSRRTIAASPVRLDCARSRTLKLDLVSLSREKVMDGNRAIERALRAPNEIMGRA